MVEGVPTDLVLEVELVMVLGELRDLSHYALPIMRRLVPHHGVAMVPSVLN